MMTPAEISETLLVFLSEEKPTDELVASSMITEFLVEMGNRNPELEPFWENWLVLHAPMVTPLISFLARREVKRMALNS